MLPDSVVGEILSPQKSTHLESIIEIIRLIRNSVADEIADKLLNIDSDLSESNPAKGVYAHAAQIAKSVKVEETE